MRWSRFKQWVARGESFQGSLLGSREDSAMARLEYWTPTLCPPSCLTAGGGAPCPHFSKTSKPRRSRRCLLALRLCLPWPCEPHPMPSYLLSSQVVAPPAQHHAPQHRRLQRSLGLPARRDSGGPCAFSGPVCLAPPLGLSRLTLLDWWYLLRRTGRKDSAGQHGAVSRSAPFRNPCVPYQPVCSP